MDIVDNPILVQGKDTLTLKCYRFFISMLTILKSPSVLCAQAIKLIDENKIHPKQLTGNKVKLQRKKWI
jgi:hypothetical protein